MQVKCAEVEELVYLKRKNKIYFHELLLLKLLLGFNVSMEHTNDL